MAVVWTDIPDLSPRDGGLSTSLAAVLAARRRLGTHPPLGAITVPGDPLSPRGRLVGRLVNWVAARGGRWAVSLDAPLQASQHAHRHDIVGRDDADQVQRSEPPRSRPAAYPQVYPGPLRRRPTQRKAPRPVDRCAVALPALRDVCGRVQHSPIAGLSGRSNSEPGSMVPRGRAGFPSPAANGACSCGVGFPARQLDWPLASGAVALSTSSANFRWPASNCSAKS